MKKTNKKISLAILALASVSLGGLAIGNVSASEASAATSLPTLESFRVEKASVRLAVSDSEQNGGIRFESLISKAAYDELTNVTEVGTLFIPTGFNLADESLALDASGNVLDQRIEKVVLEGGAENRRGGLVTTDEADVEVISYRAYINDIPDTAYATELTARSYVIADGVTYYTETLSESVGAVATSAYYDVVTVADEVYCNEIADGWYSPFTTAQRAEIGEYVQATEKTYADQYVLVAGGNATLDLSKLSVSADDVVGVAVDGAFTEWSVDGSTLTYATTVGEKTLTVATTNGVYNVALVQADQVITTYEQFRVWTDTKIENGGTLNTYEYTVLANDITATGTNWFNGGFFYKTFDGLGHTITNFTGGKGLVERNMPSSVWKNVNYVNASIAYAGGLFYYLGGGTFENVNVSAKIVTGNSLLAHGVNDQNTKFVNCDITITSDGIAEDYLYRGTSHHYALTLINTTINYAGTINTKCDCNCGAEAKLTLTNSTLISTLSTNYYAKVSGGTATFALSQMGEDAPTTVSKLKVNGVETQATLENGVLSYPATNTGATLLEMTSDKGTVLMNIAHADNVISTWDEYVAWSCTNTTTLNKYKYTVLAKDITYTGTAAVDHPENFGMVFDGLGHKIENLVAEYGIVRGLLTGGVWKNVTYTNLKQTVGEWGILSARLRGGTFDNVHITGAFTAVGNRFLAREIEANTIIANCTFTITDANQTAKVCLTDDDYTVNFINTVINYSGTITAGTNIKFTNSTIINTAE